MKTGRYKGPRKETPEEQKKRMEDEVEERKHNEKQEQKTISKKKQKIIENTTKVEMDHIIHSYIKENMERVIDRIVREDLEVKMMDHTVTTAIRKATESSFDKISDWIASSIKDYEHTHQPKKTAMENALQVINSKINYMDNCIAQSEEKSESLIIDLEEKTKIEQIEKRIMEAEKRARRLHNTIQEAHNQLEKEKNRMQSMRDQLAKTKQAASNKLNTAHTNAITEISEIETTILDNLKRNYGDWEDRVHQLEQQIIDQNYQLKERTSRSVYLYN